MCHRKSIIIMKQQLHRSITKYYYLQLVFKYCFVHVPFAPSSSTSLTQVVHSPKNSINIFLVVSFCLCQRIFSSILISIFHSYTLTYMARQMEGHPRGADSWTPPKQYSMSRVCINRQLPVVYWLRSAYTGKNNNRSDTRPAILFHPPAKIKIKIPPAKKTNKKNIHHNINKHSTEQCSHQKF